MTHDASAFWVIIAASLTMSDFEESDTSGPTSHSLEAEFSDIQAKVLSVFLLFIHRHFYSFALRFLFLHTHATSYSFFNGESRKA
jgi:hypothetical protein